MSEADFVSSPRKPVGRAGRDHDLADAALIPLEFGDIPADQRVSGSPATGTAALGTFNGHEYGVWEHTVGASSDVEADELFVVLSGAATIEFVDDGRLVQLGPGSLMQLTSGQRTVWTVTETLRKVYIS